MKRGGKCVPLDLGLLEAVVRSPDDDQPRKVCADWLEEQGDETRAEFIRLQLDTHGCAPLVDNCDPRWLAWDDQSRLAYQLMDRRDREESYGNQWDWLGVVGSRWQGSQRAFGWVRGFVASVAMCAHDFFSYAGALLWRPEQARPCPATAQPIQIVVLMTWPQIVPCGVLQQYQLRGGQAQMTWHQNDYESRLEAVRCFTHQRLLDDWPWVEFELPASSPPLD